MPCSKLNSVYMDEGTQTDLDPTAVRFLSQSECTTVRTKSLKPAAVCELLPSVFGSVALVAPDPSPTSSSTTTTSAAAAIGKMTSKLMLDLGDEISVGPTTTASATTECEATLPNIDMVPQASTSVHSDSTTSYYSQSPDDDSDEEILSLIHI